MQVKKWWIVVAVLLTIPAGLWAFGIFDPPKDSELFVSVKKGRFEISVAATGELEAKNSVSIMGPTAIRTAGIWQVKIQDLVAEGSVVKKGDYIAALDRSEITGKLRETEIELQKIESQFTQTQLDTSLTLRQARDELINLGFSAKEKELVLEQSKYEPPATIAQAKIEVEKAVRALAQANENYKIKRNQAIAKMREVSANLAQIKGKYDQMVALVNEFTIHAPEDGMVIYQREWGGRKKTVGSTINAWEPTVATLPDLTVMISKTYVNEVDIRKINTGQPVKIGLDAFPDKKLTGKVVKKANVGEQRPNSDAKVFEVVIEVSESDTTLRPAMTTSNNIIAGALEDVLHLPLECLHNEGDSLVYVYKKNGMSIVRQQVVIGQSNDNEVVILQGLAEGESVYLSVPKNAGKSQLVSLTKGDATLVSHKKVNSSKK